ncbi:hypothetical protein MELA_02160 [Candidatus Methylomirabilis lanthanidiphila]|uniref:TIGR04255 family protein n=1 Tax=Candidatus Methylomirabilis lanthanidiphila TaxID=2211376 RepID=A0A564ZKC8_9BACT|nr:TIGR04255 family protein [Candidatus Methylomirabilis lanthanidiphila]VUZ85775.1 hypothetical protein MELA_02160 [Candidatus Methylomirabilis lanthanidiphila]
MSRSPEPMPDFKAPPVIEVVLGVQFDPLPNFLTAHYGLFWSHVKDEYPILEDRAPLTEIFEGVQGVEAKGEIELVDLPPLRRVFLIHSNKNYLIQLQPTRFHHNWRKSKEGDEYPHFNTAKERFMKYWETFRTFAINNELGKIQPNQYEATYVNHIVEADGAFPAAIEDYSPLFSWSSAYSTGFLPKSSNATMSLRFRLPEERGALHVTFKHGKRSVDNKDVLILELTARGRSQPEGSDLEEWFEVAHEWIVRGFTDLTSNTAHKRWERIQ